MRILVLGHLGMLGNVVARHIQEHTDHTPCMIHLRFPSPHARAVIAAQRPDMIVNCIGANALTSQEMLTAINVELPKMLDGLGVPVMHAADAREFDGLPHTQERRRANTIPCPKSPYSVSKAEAFLWLREYGRNTKIIRSSLIGSGLRRPSLNVLDQFLSVVRSQKTVILGYTNVYTTSITTSEWARQCVYLIETWDCAQKITQCASPHPISHHALLTSFANMFTRRGTLTIRAHEADEPSGTILLDSMTPLKVPDLQEQLRKLRKHISMHTCRV